MSDDNLIPDILTRMQALGHIRLAHGVVGKTSIVAGIVFLVLGAIALRLPTDSLFPFGGVIIGCLLHLPAQRDAVRPQAP